MTKIDRPDYCCGVCPELMRGGYDCTCLGNPRCKKNKTPVLDEVLDLDQQATAGPWEANCHEVSQHWSRPEPWQVIANKEVDCGPYCYGGRARGIEKSEDAELIAYYRTAAPAMAKALQEVIALHVETGGKECLTCTDERGPKPYPCPTVKAIHKHLGDRRGSSGLYGLV